MATMKKDFGRDMTTLFMAGILLMTFTSVHANADAGVPDHINLDKLFRFRATLLNSNRPVRILVSTDQHVGDKGWPTHAILDNLGKSLIKEGALIPKGGSAGDTTWKENAHAWHHLDTQQPGLFLGVESFISTTNGGILTYSRIGGAATTVAATNVFCDTFIQPYLVEPRGGTFLIQTNTSGGGWNTCRTISANGAGTNLVVTNISLPLGYHSVRLVHSGNTATNRFKPAQIYNSTTNNLLFGEIGVISGGQMYHFLTLCSNTVSAPFWRSLNPDLFICQDFANTNNFGANWDALEATWATNCPNMDVIICGMFWTPDPGNPNGSEDYNRAGKIKALQYGRGFFDAFFYCPNLATNQEWTRRTWLIWDSVHLYNKGVDFLNGELWKAILDGTFRNLLLPSSYHRPVEFTWDSLGFSPVNAVAGVGEQVTWWNEDPFGSDFVLFIENHEPALVRNGFGVGTTFSQPGRYDFLSDQNDYGSVTINLPPQITITNPLNNAFFVEPASFTIETTVSDTPDDSIGAVGFLVGNSSGTNSFIDFSEPFTADVSNLPAGNYTLLAMAWDTRNWLGTNVVHFTVGLPGVINLAAPRLSGGQCLFRVTGLTVGKTNVLQSSTNLTSWTSLKTNTATATSATITNAVSNGLQYYRVYQWP